MSDERTRTTKEVRDGYAYDSYSGDVDPYYELRFDRWLTAHDAEIRTAALEEAALALIGHIGIQTTNGIGWIPGDSLAGAARYLRHLARAAKDGKR